MEEKRYNLELTAELSEEKELRQLEPVLELQKNIQTKEVECTPDESYQEVEHVLDESYQDVEHLLDESYLPVDCSRFKEPVYETEHQKIEEKEQEAECVTETAEAEPKPVDPLPLDEANCCICESAQVEEKDPEEEPDETVLERELVTLSKQEDMDETRYLTEDEEGIENSPKSGSRKKKGGLFKWILLLVALLGIGFWVTNQTASAAEVEEEVVCIAEVE